MLAGHAKDPVTAGLSLDALLGKGYFGRTGGHVLCFGAGGSSTAIPLHLAQKQDRADRPRAGWTASGRWLPASLVINATGMGKDLPGSPITDQGKFPIRGAASARGGRLAVVAGALCQPALPGSLGGG